MAHSVLTNATVWLAQFNVSGDLNAVDVQLVRPPKDDTCFGDTSRVMLAGVRESAFEMEGYADFGASALDNITFSRLGTANIPITVSPAGVVGDPAYSGLFTLPKIQWGGEHGENAGFSVSAAGDGQFMRGRLLANGTVTASASGTGVQFPAAPASTDRLYAALHVTAASGTSPTLNVIVQSAAASNFTGAVTRATFAQKTAAGSEWLDVAPVSTTDTWFRVQYTVGGTGPSFTFSVVFGYKTP